jgi:hypothetical protein
MYVVSAFGLSIQSDFPLPALQTCGGKADVYVQRGTFSLPRMFPTSIHRHGIEALFGGENGAAFLRWPGVASFWAQEGSRLLVQTETDTLTPELLSLFILSEAFGLILHQKGLFLLHASAVKVGERGVVFVGPPGAGKSTIAFSFALSGHTPIADDMVAIRVEPDTELSILPGFSQIKIWPSAADALDFDASSLTRIRAESQKLSVRTLSEPISSETPLSEVYLLQDGDEIDIASPSPAEAFLALVKYFSCPTALLAGPSLKRHFDLSRIICESVRVLTLKRPRQFAALRHVVSAISCGRSSFFERNPIHG